VASLSVIVATYNRAVPLRSCLESLAGQTLPAADFEVVVVVDGSTDGTAEMLGRLRLPYRLVVLSQTNRGQPAAANAGIRAAAGAYCLFVDDDVQASPDLLRAHLDAQSERSGVMGIGAMPIIVSAGSDWFARRYADNWNAHYARLDRDRRPVWNDAYGGNLSVPRAALVEVEGFATDLPAAYDIELAYRLMQKGLTPAYLPRAVGHQLEAKHGAGLAAALEREGAAAVELCRRHPPAAAALLAASRRPSRRSARLRRLLLQLDVAPRVLMGMGPLLPGMNRQRRWGRFVAAYCYWRGVRRGAGRRQWSLLLRERGQV